MKHQKTIQSERIIFYFSATGNSFSVAKSIANEFNMELVGIPSMLIEEVDNVEAKMIGIVCPVYYLEIPKIVKEFLKNTKFSSDAYIFAITTSGGVFGGSLNYINRYLKLSNSKMDYGAHITLPSNEPYERNDPNESAHLYLECSNKLQKIYKNINDRFSNTNLYKHRPVRMMTNFYWFTSNILFRMKFKKVKKSQCISCGLCEKICPVNAIKLKDGIPVFSKDCIECMACLQFCPKRAIKIGSMSITDYNHFIHQGVSAKDIAQQKVLPKELLKITKESNS